MIGIIRKPINLLNMAVNKLDDMLSNMFTKEEEDPIFELNIPDNIIYRTQLICEYIKEDKGYDFELEGFLMLIYLNFIKKSIYSYNSQEILSILTNNHYKNHYIRTVYMGSSEVTNTVKHNKTKLTISMDYNDVRKGELVLSEISDLYNLQFSFSTLLEQIWISFIENYKNGENAHAYTSIIEMLEECFG